MTDAETQQVQTYIANLQAEHSSKLAAEVKARNIAQQENIKMGLAIHEIRKLCIANGAIDPVQLATYATQIINYYCPDCDIPF